MVQTGALGQHALVAPPHISHLPVPRLHPSEFELQVFPAQQLSPALFPQFDMHMPDEQMSLALLGHVLPEQHNCPLPPHAWHFGWGEIEVLQERFVPPVQLFPLQQNCPAELPQASHFEDDALQISVEPVQTLPVQHGCPAPPHAWHRMEALQMRFGAPVQVVPPQQGWPAAEPHVHLAGEPVQTRLLEQLEPLQHGWLVPPHVTQSEPSQASEVSLQAFPAQHCAFNVPQHPAPTQSPQPLHVPASLREPFWSSVWLLFCP